MQLEINIEGLSKEIQQVIHEALLSANEHLAGTRTWYSHQDAISILGWPEMLLKKGVEYGDLTPITLQGRGGTHYSAKDLSEYHDKILKKRRSHSFDPKYLTNATVYSLGAKKKCAESADTGHSKPDQGPKRAG